MTALRKTALFPLVAALLTSAAFAAPNGTPDPVADCFNSAQLQYQIEYAQCYAFPLEAGALRAQCEAQALVKYGSATAACSSKSTSVRTNVSVGAKTNLDQGFMRRLRH